SKSKTITAVVLAAGLLLAGAGVLAQKQPAARPAEPPRAGTPAAAPKETPRDREPAKSEAADDKAEKVTVSRVVLGPQGKPFPGAEIYLWWHFGGEKPDRMRPRATSGDDGRFRITFAKSEIDDPNLNTRAEPWRLVDVVAAAKGYGPAWEQVSRAEKEEL